MNIANLTARVLALLAIVVFISGCTEPTSGKQSRAEASEASHSTGDHHDHASHGDHDDGHDHGEEHQGPHDGHVIELGRNHEYHAEMVENEEASTVTIHILDKDLNELPIDQRAIAMNLMVDGQAESFELIAAATDAGTASQFDATNKDLFEALHLHEATGKLRVTINDKPYSGDVAHHHHHADEDGDHEHSDGHGHSDDHEHSDGHEH